MSSNSALGPDPQHLYTYRELPIGATAVGLPPQKRKTGLWRYMRPTIIERTPPCQAACPAGNWIQRFVGAVAAGRDEEAYQALKLENPFPGVCGRVCYHPCEEACNRVEVDGATSIHAVERHLAERFAKRSQTPPAAAKEKNRRVGVVGSGPAGLAGAYFLRLMGYWVTVFEATEALGGTPRLGIPPYRLPREVLDREINDVLALGVEAKTGLRVGRDVSFEHLAAEFEALLLATGAHGAKALGLPGEDLPGVHRGLDFLARFNLRGEAAPGRDILVVGGGNAAIDVVRTLLRLGRRPRLIYRRTRQQMPAHDEEIEEALAEGARMEFLLSPTGIRRLEGGRLGLKCAGMELQGLDRSGRPEAVLVPGQEEFFEADQIILAIGETPDLSYLPLELNPAQGFIPAAEWGQTQLPHVFAAGDAFQAPWSVAQAIGSAKRAAIALDRHLSGEDPARLAAAGNLAQTMRAHLGLADKAEAAGREVVRLSDLNRAYILKTPALKPGKLTPDKRRGNFEEVVQGLDGEAARSEAGRCLSCGVCRLCGRCYLFCPDAAVRLDAEKGRYVIDYDYCKGCGICGLECPVAAIDMESEGEA